MRETYLRKPYLNRPSFRWQSKREWVSVAKEFCTRHNERERERERERDEGQHVKELQPTFSGGLLGQTNCWIEKVFSVFVVIENESCCSEECQV